MKKIIYICLAMIFMLSFIACDDDVNESNSIFDTTAPERNEFDKWILDNYGSYNIDLKYKMEDIESDVKYDLVPAEYNKSVAFAILAKHLWLEVYDEEVDIHFTRENIPRIIHLVGSPAYKSNGNVVLGTAEGGKKVTMYNINAIDFNKINAEKLLNDYFHTMHHEFAHILHQKKLYPKEFKSLTDGLYLGDKWSDKEYTETIAYELGFTSRYSRSSPDEDFVEVYSNYVTFTEDKWNTILKLAGENGAPIITEKFNIVKDYMMEMWGIDIESVRKTIHRRANEVSSLDLTISKTK